MEVRVLRYFLAVAREESITAAAHFLHLTQPTLSRQIHDLEAELGQQLLVRKSHRVVLTPEGMLLRKRAEEILNMVDKTEAEFRALDTTISGDVYIGSGETQAIRQIAEILRQIQREYPAIHYHMHSGNAQDITDRLDNGLLDFGVLIQPADITKYDSLELPAKDVWGVVMRKDSPLSQKQSVSRDDLRHLPLLCSRQALLSQRHGNAFASWFGADYDKLNIVCTYNLIYNAAIMVEQGIGYAITLDNLANTSASSALCFRPLSPCLESGLNIVWKKYQVFSPAAELLLQRMQEAFSLDQRTHNRRLTFSNAEYR